MQAVRLITEDSQKLITKLRHVDVYNHWLREAYNNKTVLVKWVDTNSMPADGFTKPLPRQKHENFVRQLRLVDIAQKIQQLTK